LTATTRRSRSPACSRCSRSTSPLPFQTSVLGVTVTVTRVDLTVSDQVVAICRRDRVKQAIPILDLPLPAPAPDGAEWIDAYRRWHD
jgi:hypothetical protein